MNEELPLTPAEEYHALFIMIITGIVVTIGLAVVFTVVIPWMIMRLT